MGDDDENMTPSKKNIWPANLKSKALLSLRHVQDYSTTLDDIQDYSTLDDQTGRCYVCKDWDEKCKLVQSDMFRAVQLRSPLQLKPMKKCGREGTVFVYEKTVVKILPMSPEEHMKRAKIWALASLREVGPYIADPSQIRFELFRFNFKDTLKLGWTGWSTIQTVKLEEIFKPNLDSILDLVSRTSRAGLLHIDASMSNIMMNAEKKYFFVDWEYAITFEPRVKKRGICPFCRIAYVFMLSKLLVSFSETGVDFSQDTRKRIDELINEKKTTIKLKDVRNMLSIIDATAVQQHEIVYFLRFEKEFELDRKRK